MRSARRLALSLALAVTAAVFMSGTALAASPGVVISQVYGGGGNAGAPCRERLRRALQPRHGRRPARRLFAPVRERDRHRQLRGELDAADRPLRHASPAGGYFLVGLASGGAKARRCPPRSRPTRRRSTWPRARAKSRSSTRSRASAATAARRRAAPTQLAHIIDLVGYGTGTSGANFFEGRGPAPTISATARRLSRRARAARTPTTTQPTSAPRRRHRVTPRPRRTPVTASSSTPHRR